MAAGVGYSDGSVWVSVEDLCLLVDTSVLTLVELLELWPGSHPMTVTPSPAPGGPVRGPV